MNAASLIVRPHDALAAYRRSSDAGGAGQPGDFGEALQSSLQSAIATGQDADARAVGAVTHGGDLTHVVTAVSQAQIALQEVVAVRDKVVSAYQEVMRMAI